MIPTLFKKLLFARQFRYENGCFYLMMNVPGIILPMRVLVKVQHEVLRKKRGAKILYEIGYEHGKNAGLRYKTYMVPGLSGFLQFLKDTSEVVGLGKVQIMYAENNRFIAHISPAPFAEVWRKEIGPSKKPVCHYVAGIFAGVLSGFSGKEARAWETKCVACGHPYCEIIGEIHDRKVRRKARKLRD